MKTIKKVSVQNMMSNAGNDIANQFEIYTDNGKYFQSYSSIIAYRRLKDGQIFLDRNKWDYSVTTGKYRNMFLGEMKKDTQAKIDSGEYRLVDLN